MPKLFAVRWLIGVFVAVSLVAATIGFATTLSGPPAKQTASRDDYAAERAQLLFFKAAVGRIDQELAHRGADATPSLRIEREAVLRRMREVADRVPPDRLPLDLAALLPPAPLVAAAATSHAPAAKADVRELQTGLGTRPADLDFSSLALDHPAPLPIYVERPPRRAEHARDADGSEKHAERSGRERAAKDKDRAAAEKPAREPAPADRAAKERAPVERASADHPPITVQRTAIADQSESRQPTR